MTREEIAERLRANATGDLHRELADAVRALPVIATCGACQWCAPSEVCTHPHAERLITLLPPRWTGSAWGVD